MFAWIEASTVSGIAFGICDVISQCGERIHRNVKRQQKQEQELQEQQEKEKELNKQDDGTNTNVEKPITVGIDAPSALEEFSWFRLARFSALGACYGPVLFQYYRVLDVYFHGQVWPKILIGAFVYNPTMLTLYISVNQVIKDKGSLQNVGKAMKEQFPSVVMTGALYWFTIDWVNFTYIPVEHQVAFTRSFGILFDIYLTFASNGRNIEAVEDTTTTTTTTTERTEEIVDESKHVTEVKSA
eukprot:PhF_6_TR26548/c0_g1_i1/m.38393/K13348/MPV17; protein Mpv17